MNLPVLARPLEPAERAARLAEAFIAGGERSPHTRTAYRLDITGCSSRPDRCAHRPDRHGSSAWLPWCLGRDLDPLGGMRPAHVLAWLADLADAGDGEATRARRLSAVSSWYEWLLREEAVERNPVTLRPAERPKSSSSIHLTSPVAVLSSEQTSRLIEVADATRNPRTAALVVVLAVTGARVAEVVGANLEDVTLDRGHPVLRIMGKGGKVRLLPLPPAAYVRLEVYLEARRTLDDRLPARAGDALPGQPLFARVGGKRLTRQEVARTLHSVARRAGWADFADRITPHSLRHSYATDLLEAGVPVRDVQYAMGHVDPRTTERYDHGRFNPDRHPSYRRAALLEIGEQGSADD